MKPLMLHGGAYEAAFIVAVVLFAVQQFPALWSTLRLRLESDRQVGDNGSFGTIQISVLAGVILGYEAATHISGTTITPYRPAVYYLGIGIMIAGSIICAVAIYQLGRYFTVVVAVRPDQSVIQNGLYGLVRHPSYLGQILVYLGLGIAFTNWLSLPILLACILPGYVYRIGIEERTLSERLGSAYTEYAGRTFRLLPGVW